MRKLGLSALIVLLLCGTAFAHNGALSLYRTIVNPGSPATWDCDQTISFLQTDTISVYYIKDQGPDLGNAVEFKLLSSNPAAIFVGVAWSPIITVTLGDVDNGISLTAAQCMGAGETVVFIGDVYVFFTDGTFPSPSFTVKVVPDPAVSPPEVLITRCEAGNPIQGVLGGWFIFNGSCNPGVQSKSWGAIKELFK